MLNNPTNEQVKISIKARSSAKLKIIRFLAAAFTLIYSSSTFANPAVIVISGGINEFENHSRYYEKIEKLMKLFPTSTWDHYHLVADGPSSQPNSPEQDKDGNPERDIDGRIKLSRRDPPPGATYYQAAKLDQIQLAFSKAAKNLKPGEPIILYLSDHGSISPEGSAIVHLWKSTMNSKDLAESISVLGENHPIIMFHEQCFGSDMLEELLGPHGNLYQRFKTGKVCGFASGGRRRTSNPSEQLIPTLYEMVSHQSTESPFKDIKSQNHKLHELMAHSHLHFTTNPLSSSEIFLLSYREMRKMDSSQSPTCSNCKKPVQNLDVSSFSSTSKSTHEITLQKQKQYYRTWLDQVSLSPEDLQKLAFRCKSMEKVEVQKTPPFQDAINRCQGELRKASEKTSQSIFQQKKQLAQVYLEMLPEELRNFPDKLKLAQKQLAIIRKNLAEENQKDNPDPLKTARMEKGIKNKLIELEKLENIARPVREDQISVISGKNEKFNLFLEKSGKKQILDDLMNGLKTQKELMRLRSIIAKINEPVEILDALDLLSDDPEALTIYLNLVNCETDPFESNTANLEEG